MATIAEKWFEQGLEQGLEQGRAQGLKQGLARSIISVLERRFSNVPAEDILPHLERLSVGSLETLLDEAVTTFSLDSFMEELAATSRGATHQSNVGNE